MPEYIEHLAELLRNLTLILALILVQSLCEPLLVRLPVWLRRILEGLAFGGLTIIAMLLPVHVADGVQIDPKTIVTLLAVVSGGPITGTIAAVIGIAGRAYLGGVGAIPGSMVVVSGWLVGMAIRVGLRRRVQDMNAFLWIMSGLLLAVFTLACTLMLPADVRWKLYASFGVPVAVYYPIATFMVGMVYSLESKRRATEQRLTASDQRYRSLVEHSPDAILVHRNMRIVYANPQAVKLLRAKAEDDLVGREMLSLLPQQYHAVVTERIEQTLATGEHAAPLIEQYIRMDGSIVDVEVTGTRCDFQGGPAVQIQVRDVTSRARMEQRVHRQADRLRLAIDAADLAILDWSPDEKVLRRQRIARRILGGEREQFDATFDDLFAHVHPDDRSRVMDEARRALAEGQTFVAEYRLAGHDNPRWMRAHGRMVTHNRSRRVVLAMQEITSQRLHEEALRISEQRLELAIHGGELGVWDWNIVTGQVYFNDRWASMLEYSLDEIEPHVSTWQTFVHPDDQADVMRVLNAHLEGHTPMYTCEHRLRTKSGGWKWILDQGKVVQRDAAGRPLRAVGTQLDIDERKRSEARIAESEARARQYFNMGVVGMGTSAPGKGWIEVNDELCRMLGYSRDELIKLTWAHVTYPDDLQKDLSQFNRVLAGEIDAYDLEKRYIRKDGSILHAHISVACSRDQDGNVQDFIALVHDVTERKEAERHRKLMLSELDHRVKNNLATVLAMLDQTLSKATDIQQFARVFRGRVHALSRTHETLARSHWRGVTLREVVGLVLAPFATEDDPRVSFGGDSVQLATRLCMPISMTLHELLTNATKYGALSTLTGRVNVNWTVAEGSHINITWTETDGPAVTPPTRRGSGSDLIEGLVAYELQGQVNVHYAPTGLVCTIMIPLNSKVDATTMTP